MSMQEMIFIEKKRQEKILENNILDSWLVTKEVIDEARKLYPANPFHNFLHALNVSSYVLELPWDIFSALELRSMLVAGLFHDAWHTWIAHPLDEFISLSLLQEALEKIQEKDRDFIIDYSIVRNAVMGTVFKERWKRTNRYSVILSDFDIWYIWKWIESFLYYWPLFALELKVSVDDFFTKVEKWYFKFLMNIEKQVLISPYSRKILPHSLQTIKDFYSIDLEVKKQMFETLKDEDITFDEFKNKFFKKS
ncbi:MAG: hypothetical protein ACD_3C00223G0012 [uncultured bacterium (gcode 4)]|uniref:HD domain-containing protein n=1 Tax=uncultured bacterium (gcode 4) TaxID=1234023 RepID=K2GVI4_9BACT|nr:MAG: hypothetical protein ACD_3C00223G0012 [uncultured bacterium (gcode 4)]